MDFYKGYEGLIEFSSATRVNPFGAQLLSLCEGKFEDIETAVAVITDGLEELGFDVDEEGVVGLMTGEVLPSEEVLEAISGLADTDADVGRLYDSANAAYEVAEAALGYDYGLEDEDEYEDESEDDSDMDTVEDEDYYYAEGDDDEAQAYHRNAQEDLAEQLYSRQVVTDTLNNYVEIADQMMAGGQGLMTPHIKELLFGKSDKNRFINFSAATEDSGMSAHEYLQCINFSLNLLSELGGVDSFYFEPQVDDAIGERVNFSARDESAVEAEARAMLDLLNS